MIFYSGVIMSYTANNSRYQTMKYNRLGNSGLKLSALSLGLWHNFGGGADSVTINEILRTAFDNGITHFDLANNYGPPPGSAEENFGKILKKDFKNYRDEIIISSKAGYFMWEGPYGEWGSKKYLTASLDQSLRRTGLEYFDIFYHHRPDDNTDLEETACALDLFVRQGKALYIGVSNYSAQQTESIIKIFNELKTPFVIHQPKYSLLNRWVEDGLSDVLTKHKKGMIAFSPLAQGMLTDRYLKGIPDDSRVRTSHFLKEEQVNSDLPKIIALNEIAKKRGQSLAQMSIAWLLNKPYITSVLIGVSKVEQLKDNLKAIENTVFSEEELREIDKILK